MAMPRIRPFSNAALFFAAGLCLACIQTQAQGLNATDLVSLARLSEPAVSPHNGAIAYTLRTTNLETDERQSDIWMTHVGAQATSKQLTTHSANDYAAEFSQDGDWVYFLSDRGGLTQVWRLPLDFGDAQPVTDYPVSVQGFRLSPDNRFLILSASLYVECELDLACSARKQAQETVIRSYDRLLVRHWDRWLDGSRNTLLAQPLNKEGLPEKDLISLSGSLEASVPGRPFGGFDEIAVSPDSRQVVFAAKLASTDEAWSTNYDLYRVPIGGGRPRNLTEDNAATDTGPVFGPDGALYYRSMARAGYEADKLSVVRLRGNEKSLLAPDWDRSAAKVVVAENGRIFALANDTGKRRVFELADGRALPITAFGWVSDLVSHGDDLLIALESMHQPADLYRVDGADNALYRLTSANKDALANIQFGVYEQFNFPGWNDETVYGFVMKPAGFDPQKEYPLAFIVHGGPQGTSADRFHYRWNPQFYAGLGYVVAMIDFHGSTGYGQSFTDSIRGDWGGKPLVDLQLGLTHLVSSFPFIDGENVCALGASYGGYMINWIAGNWPNRFKCLVNHDGVFDNRMMYYTTEELWFPEWEFGGPQFDVPAEYETHNPVNHVNAWQTPMLVIHGANDFRVPETQGLAAFTALQRRGIDSEFLYFEEENHWVLSPSGSLKWHARVADWLARYLER